MVYCAKMSAESASLLSTTVTIPIWRHPDLHWAEKLMSYVLWLVLPFAAIPRGALERCRRRFDKMSADGFDSALSKGGWTQESLTPPGSTMEIVLCRPADSTAKDVPLVVHLHGGAYTLGVAKDSFPTALWLGLAKEGTPLVVASVSYRLAPEHPAPAAQQDVEAALAYLSSAELAARFGYDPARVHIWGASAGAGLALVVGAAMCRGGSRKPRSLFLDCPMVDPGCDTPSCAHLTTSALHLCSLRSLRSPPPRLVHLRAGMCVTPRPPSSRPWSGCDGRGRVTRACATRRRRGATPCSRRTPRPAG